MEITALKGSMKIEHFIVARGETIVQMADRIFALANPRRSEVLTKSISLLVWSRNDYFGSSCQFRKLEPEQLGEIHNALRNAVVKLREYSDVVVLLMISPEGYERCFGPSATTMQTLEIKQRLEKAWKVVGDIDGVVALPLDNLFMDHLRSDGTPTGWHLQQNNTNYEAMVETLVSATKLAVRIAIIKRVYGYKTDKCRDVRPLPSIRFEDLSPDALRKDAEEAQKMALIAAVPEVITVDIGRRPGSVYNSDLVPVRTWPNVRYFGEAQHNFLIPLNPNEYLLVTGWGCPVRAAAIKPSQDQYFSLSSALSYHLRVGLWKTLREELRNAPGRVMVE